MRTGKSGESHRFWSFQNASRQLFENSTHRQGSQFGQERKFRSSTSHKTPIMAGLTSVAFGPNDTWAVCEDAGTTWSYGLPDNIYNTLEGRSKKRRCAPTNVAAMGHGNTYAIFATDTNWWSNHDDLVEQLNEHGIHGSDVKAVSFGDCGSYLLLNRNARAITIVL